MAKLRDNELMRYHDGELREGRARRVRAMVDEDSELQIRLQALEEVGELTRVAADDAVVDADFDALWQGIAAGIADEPKATTGERFAAWIRRHWVATASAVAAAALLVVVATPLLRAGGTVNNDCQIESLEVGAGAVSAIFKIKDQPGPGSGTTVIWVSESSSGDSQ